MVVSNQELEQRIKALEKQNTDLIAFLKDWNDIICYELAWGKHDYQSRIAKLFCGLKSVPEQVIDKLTKTPGGMDKVVTIPVHCSGYGCLTDDCQHRGNDCKLYSGPGAGEGIGDECKLGRVIRYE